MIESIQKVLIADDAAEDTLVVTEKHER